MEKLPITVENHTQALSRKAEVETERVAKQVLTTSNQERTGVANNERHATNETQTGKRTRPIYKPTIAKNLDTQQWVSQEGRRHRVGKNALSHNHLREYEHHIPTGNKDFILR